MMRKLICAVLCLAVCIGSASCGKTQRRKDGASPVSADEAPAPTDPSVTSLGVYVFTASDHKKSKSFDREIAGLSYPVVGLSDADAARYPALAQTLGDLNVRISDSAKERYAAVGAGAAEDLAADPQAFRKHESTTRLFVRRADSLILSLLYETYTYAGGGEGTGIWSANTFDAVSGKELSLSDLVSDLSALPRTVRELLLENYPDTEFFGSLDLAPRFTEDGGELCWLADDAGLTFVFNPNDIAPAADGSIAVTIPYGDPSGPVRTEYAVRPAACAVALPPELPYSGDLDGDGRTDRLTVGFETDEYGAYFNTQCISFNQAQTQDGILALEVGPVLMHAADGRSFLYTQELLDNAYRQIAVYRFSGGKAEKVGAVAGGFGCAASAADTLGLLPTDPNRFVLENWTELLSTAAGRRVCHLGRNGLPEADDGMYTLVQPVGLTLLLSLAVKTLGDDGSVTGETTLPAGTALAYIRTDGERSADLRLADGSEVRVEVGRSDWGFTVAGFDVREVFDGVIYAG